MDPVADELIGLLSAEREAAGESLDRERAPVGSEQVVVAQQAGQRRLQERLQRLESELADSGVVGVQQPPVGSLDGDRVRDVAEDRLGLLREDETLSVGDRLVAHRRRERNPRCGLRPAR